MNQKQNRKQSDWVQSFCLPSIVHERSQSNSKEIECQTEKGSIARRDFDFKLPVHWSNILRKRKMLQYQMKIVNPAKLQMDSLEEIYIQKNSCRVRSEFRYKF
ncbi:hypothetical protein pb186bvf_008116 [Paramecium bursaria]